MVVKVSKPEINVREKISELDKPSGTAGQAMLAAETPQEQFNLIGAGRRNLIINGDFSIWQRGTSGVTGYASSAWKYAADRWKFYTRGNTGVGSFTKSTTEIDGVSYDAAYFQLTTGNTAGAAFIAQFIEGVAARGKDITFSFWYEHISGEYPSLRIEGVGNNVLATVVDGWNTVTTKSNNTFGANGLYVGIGAPSANPCSFKFTHAQLELGKVATPFEHRSYGEELALCQRYYQVGTFVGNGGTDLGDTNPTVSWMPQTAMRATASMGVRDDNAAVNRYTDPTSGSVSWVYGGPSHRADNISFSGSYANGIDQGLFVLDLGNTSSGVGSWIRFHWYADAEL
jgi:hypothetical protein